MHISLAELMVSVGMMDSVAHDHPIYADGWREKLENIRDGALTLTEEVHSFGEAFDEPS